MSEFEVNHNKCQFCDESAFKTNGKSELICLSRANTGKCSKEWKENPVQNTTADYIGHKNIIKKNTKNELLYSLCSCNSGKKYKFCCYGSSIIR